MGMIPSIIATQTVMRKIEERKKKGGNPMSKEEMEQLADILADKLRDMDTTVLILHSIPYSHGSPGVVVAPDVAARTPCKCYENICFSPGIIGALSKPQREAYCPTTEHVTSPGMTRRLKNWQESVDVCKERIESIPKGERLIPYIECMGQELPKRGIEI